MKIKTNVEAMNDKGAMTSVIDTYARSTNPGRARGRNSSSCYAIRNSHPITSSQREVWFDQLLHGDVPLYNIGGYVRISGSVDPERFERAVNLLVQKHDCLRTILIAGPDEDNVPLQVFAEEMPVQVPLHDFSIHADPHLAALEWMQQRFEESFALYGEKLFRYDLLKIGPDCFYWLKQYHHLVVDGWTIAMLVRSLGTIYSALEGNEEPDLSAPSYLDFIQNDRSYIESAQFHGQRQYWLKKYETLPEPLFAPRYRSRFVDRIAPSESRALCLPRDLYNRLIEFATANHSTTFHAILGALYVYFTRTARRDEVVIGLPVLNRANAAFKATAGLFVGISATRFNFGRDLSFRDLLQAIGQELKQVYRHQRFPVSESNRAVGLRHTDRLQIFDLSVSYERHDYDAQFGQAQGQAIPCINGYQQTPLALFVREFHDEEDVWIHFVYNLAYFESTEIEAIQRRFVNILEFVLNDASASVETIPVLPEAERHQLLVEWNDTAADYRREACVHHLFEEQVKRSHDSPALVFEGRELTYGQLNARANQLARFLSRCGVTPGTFVGVCMERGIDLITSILGILKVGAAYMPLDPGYPDARLRFMLEDSGVALVLTHRRLTDPLSDYLPRAIHIDSDWPKIASEDPENLGLRATPESLAYVIYTSGSTGKPKGTLLEHRGLCNVAAEQIRLFGVGPGSRVLQFSSPNFDASLFDIVMALATGGTLVLSPKEDLLPGPSLSRTLREQRITILTIPPSSLDVLTPEALPYLKTINVAGEPCPPQLISRWALGRDFSNLYGPTECTIWVTGSKCVANGATPHIGRPIANTQVYVLDPQGEPVPIGVTGELFIGGVGVGRGYLNRFELTAERFRSDNFSRRPGARLYRTGDLVRYRSDGNLEFVGRIDEQVKVRGFRIELGEIEAGIARHSAVREVVVLAREDAPGDKRLVAYLVAENPPADLVEQLRALLRGSLPEYMVPAHFVTLEALPLTPNGKLDRKALPVPERSGADEAAYVAPRGVLEQRIAAVWREVLRLEHVGVTDNFFDLGGHSLLVVKTHARLCAELKCKLKVVDLLTYPNIEALARYVGTETRTDTLANDALARVNRRRNGSKQAEPIAIIGMAGRFPGAGDVESFWSNLRQGKESIAFFSAEEMRASGVPEAILSDSNLVPAGGYLEDADKFDAGFFGYSPREAEIIDPQQRLLLECAAEVLERAGYDPDRYQGLIGVYAGSSTNGYLTRAQTQHDGLSSVLGSGRDFLTTRVSYKLNLRGPSLNVQTACSTSLVAVHQACRALWDYECDMALAGGVSVTMPLKSGYIYMQEGIGSPDGHCRAFDAGANGTVGGNGVAMVMLKRLSEALADGDSIHAVIGGTGINNDGSSKVGYTAPSVEGQAQAIALAQAAAQFDPDTIGYVEAHGTGTLLGDPIEMSALTRVFGDGRQRHSPCWIGSVKTNVGHLDAAAGVTGLIKATLSLEHKELVPSLHFSQPNPQIDFAAGPFKVNTELRKWESPEGTVRRAGVSSFGLGGTNAHVVLEEAPALEPSGSSREWQLLCLSAKTDAALAQAKANLSRHLSEHPDINLADAAYTLQIGRREFSHRCVVVCRDAADAASALGSGASQRVISGFHKSGKPSVQFLFTGQGAQYANMGLGLYRTEAVFREIVDQCCERLKSRLGLDLREVLFPADDALEQAAERLQQTELTQPALFVIEYALAKLWMSLGIQPAAMIGHSIGEYVAACLAGVMSVEDALDLVTERGRLMGQLPPGSMLAVPLSEAEVLPLLSEQLSIASINSPTLCVVSGPAAEVAAVETRLLKMELAPRRLHTSHAFHSSMMAPILEPFTQRVRAIKLNRPQLPYISNVTGDWITTEQATDPAYYVNHLRQTVQFAKGLEQLFADPNSVFLEVGPGHTLTALAKRHPAKRSEHAFVASMRHPDESQADEVVLMESVGRLWLAGVRPEWSALHAGHPRRRVRLPTYPFERKRYWIEPNQLLTGPEGRSLRGDPREWVYRPSWKSAPAPASEASGCGANWLVFTDEHGLGSQLEAELIGRGAKVASVALGERFAINGPGKYALNPAAREDYDQLFAELKKASFIPQFIVHLWSVSRDEELREDAQFLTKCEDLGFFSVVYLVQALEAAGLNAPLRVAVVTTQACEVSGREALCPEKALVLGPCKVIGMEHPHIRVRSVNVTLNDDVRWIGRALASDLSASWTEPVVAYRRRFRWVQTFQNVRLEVPAGRPALLRDSGVYLITGGLGDLGLEVADYLARTVRARLALISRTGLLARERWALWLAQHDQNDTTSRKIRRVQDIETAGAEVLVCQADVADEREMSVAIAAVEARLGPLCGVMHAAAAQKRGVPIQSLRRSDCEEQFRPKQQGLRVLEKLLEGKDLDFCVVHSSLASVMGAMSFVSYTASHLFMDAFACKHNRRAGMPWRVVNWDNWNIEAACMGGQKAAMTQFYVTPAEATDALGGLLSMPDATQILVSSGELQRRIDQWVRREVATAEAPIASDTAIPAPRAHPRPALSTEYEAPRTDAERMLTDLWKQMLGIDRVGVHDNFFELGGDSVLNIQITAKANQAGLRLTPKQVFDHSTIAALAAIAGAGAAIATEQGVVTGPVPLTPIQRWFFDLNLNRPQHFNQPMLLEVRRPLDISILAQVVERLERHHDALRLRFFKGKGGWKQQLVEATGTIKVHKFDLAGLTAGEQGRRIEAMGTEVQTSLDLAKGPLLQVAYFDLGPGRSGRLLLAIHHLVVDMISWRILLEDMRALYDSLSRGGDATLPAKTASIKRWAEALTEYAQTKAAEAELGYWMDIAAKPVLRLPVDFEAGANTVGSSASIHEELSVEETRALLTDLPRACRTQINDALLLALVKSVCGWTGGSSAFVDLEGHGREAILDDIDVSRTVGWFTTLGLVRLELPAAKGLRQQIRSVQAQLQAVPHHGMGFGVLRYLSANPVVTGALEKLPRPEISFLYMGQFDQGFSSDSLFVPASESVGPVNDPEGERDHLLEVNSIVTQGRLRVSWTYSSNWHREETVRSLARAYMETLRSLIASCRRAEADDDAFSTFKGGVVSDSDLAEIERQLEAQAGVTR